MSDERPSETAAAADHRDMPDDATDTEPVVSEAASTTGSFAPSPPPPLSPPLLDDAPRLLQTRVKTLWRIGFLLQAILPSALAGVASWLVWRDESIWPAIGFAATPFVIAGLLAWRLPGRRYAAWQYRLTADALRLDRGVMVRIESVVPYTRIQHVDTEQGPIERALGLTRVIVHTASGSGSTLTIPGLSPDEAAQLREQLALLAGVVEPL